MTRILSAAILSAVIAGPVLADGHVMDMSDLIRTRDITGGPVYSISSVYDEATWGTDEYVTSYGYEAVGGFGNDGLRQIGEIEDIVLDRSGQMVGVVAEIGGFLDIGDKHVMVPVADMRLVPVDDASYSFVTRLSEEQLEALPGVDEGWFD